MGRLSDIPMFRCEAARSAAQSPLNWQELDEELDEPDSVEDTPEQDSENKANEAGNTARTFEPFQHHNTDAVVPAGTVNPADYNKFSRKSPSSCQAQSKASTGLFRRRVGTNGGSPPRVKIHPLPHGCSQQRKSQEWEELIEDARDELPGQTGWEKMPAHSDPLSTCQHSEGPSNIMLTKENTNPSSEEIPYLKSRNPLRQMRQTIKSKCRGSSQSASHQAGPREGRGCEIPTFQSHDWGGMQDTDCSSGEQGVNICSFCSKRETKGMGKNVPHRVATNPNEEISLEPNSFKGTKGSVKVEPRLASDECRSQRYNCSCYQQVNPIPAQQDTDSDHSDHSPQITAETVNRPSRRPPKGRKGSTHPGPGIIGSWCLGVATVLIMALLNPASAQATPMPEMEVFDIYGNYSGQTPIVRTVSLINMKECKDLSEIYNNPITESVQVLRKVNALNIDILQCKVVLDFVVSHCGYSDYGNYLGPMTVRSNVMHPVSGDSCLKLHNGDEAETMIEGNQVKIIVEKGKLQETHFIETKGLVTPEAACEGEDFTLDEINYKSSVLTIAIKSSISRSYGQYDPRTKLLTTQDGTLLRPMEMRHVNTTGMVFKNGTYGTILVPIDEILASSPKMMESLYQGDALILKPRNDLNANGSEPTILVIKEGNSHKEASFSLQRPQAVYGKFMMKADVPGIYIYMLEGQQEPLFVKERDAGLGSLSKNNTLAAYVTPVPIHNILTPSNTLSQVSLELCNAARNQQLQIMAEMNGKSVHFGKARPGVLAKKAGEVVHLLQGVSMKAWLRDDAHGGCYDDIPVRVRTDAGETVNLFATPLSLIVKPTSPLVNCSDTPVMFQAKNGDWFSTTKGGLQIRKPPIELTPHSFMWRNKDSGLDWSPTNIREAKKLEVFLHDHAKALEALHHHQHTSTFQQNTEEPSTTADQGNRTESCSFLGRVRRLVKAARTKILEIVDGKSKIMGTNAGKVLMATLALSTMPAALFVLWLFMHMCAIMICLCHSLLISMVIMLIQGHNQIMAARELGRSTSEPNAHGLQDKILIEKLQENDRRISALTASQLSLGARVANWEESTPISHG